MSTIYTESPGRSRRPELGSYRLTAAEKAAWPLFAPYHQNGRALWIDADRRQMVGANVGDYPQNYNGELGFQLQDRVSERQFGIGISTRHAVRIDDGAQPGRFQIGFGIGETDSGSPNYINAEYNGDLVNISKFNSSGSEISRLPLIRPGGFTALANFRSGAEGGVFLGSANDDGYKALVFGIHPVSKQLVCRTQFDLDSGQTGALGVISPLQYHSVSSPTKVVVAFNASTKIMTMWVNRVQVTNATNVRDVADHPDTALPHLGGVGKTTNVWPLRGLINFLGWLPGAVAENPRKRAILFDLMESK